jgi:hypothetical protein
MVLWYQKTMREKLLQPKNQKRRGRPATGVGTPVQVRLSDDLLSRLDDFRRDLPDIPGRPEAIRRLVERGLK